MYNSQEEKEIDSKMGTQLHTLDGWILRISLVLRALEKRTRNFMIKCVETRWYPYFFFYFTR